MTTGPTKEKPSFFICLDIFCDRSLEAGTSSKLAISCTIGVSTSLKNICVIVFLKCYKVCYNLATRW